MGRSRGSFRGRSPVRQRRRTGWTVGPGGATEANITASSVTILGSGIVTTLDGHTIARIRGEFMAYLISATAVNDGFGCALGIGLVTEDAFDVGATAVPDPLTEMEWDGWMYHRLFAIRAPGVIVGAASEDADNVMATTSAIRFEVDTKAMRKFEERMALIAVLEVVENGTAVMQVNFNSRMLLFLP